MAKLSAWYLGIAMRQLSGMKMMKPNLAAVSCEGSLIFSFTFS